MELRRGGTARLSRFAANGFASVTTPASHSDAGPRGHFGLIFEKPDFGVFQHNRLEADFRRVRLPAGASETSGQSRLLPPTHGLRPAPWLAISLAESNRSSV